MARERANLKIQSVQLERFNNLRPDETTQAEFLDILLDAHENDSEPGSQRITSGNGEQLDSIEGLLRTLSDEHGRMKDQLTSIQDGVETVERNQPDRY